MDKVLIDTDEILDFFFDRKPYADYSAEVLNLWAKKIAPKETLKY